MSIRREQPPGGSASRVPAVEPRVPSPGPRAPSPEPRAPGFVGYRWYVCALLFFAATINYVDRQVVSILKPDLQALFGWTDREYGWIAIAFQGAYALGFLGAGRVMDRLGVRLGLSIAILVWSLAAMAHAFVGFFGPAAVPVLALTGLA